MDDLIKRRVSLPLLVGIIFLPFIFVWLLLRKGYSGVARTFGFGWALLAVILFVSSDSPKPVAAPPKTTKSVETKAPPKPAPIADGAVSELTRASYPKAWKQWGKDGFRRINELQPKAAELAAQNSTCKRVDVVGLSDRSQPRDSIVFFVDCQAGVRLYISDIDIEAGTPAESDNQKLAKLDDSDLLMLCSERAKAQMQYPSTYKMKVFSSDVSRGGYGRARINVAFEAKNGFGAELPGQATCYVEGSQMSGPEITNR